jgi:very-short-patch-repair endonuclease
VVDFACHRHRLVVEADGPFHDEARDTRRDDWLKSKGYRVLRFTIAALERDQNTVVQMIIDPAGV